VRIGGLGVRAGSSGGGGVGRSGAAGGGGGAQTAAPTRRLRFISEEGAGCGGASSYDSGAGARLARIFWRRVLRNRLHACIPAAYKRAAGRIDGKSKPFERDSTFLG
jgi:hypothetical protein